MRQLLLSLQLSILNYCVKKGGRKSERRGGREEERERGREERREEEERKRGKEEKGKKTREKTREKRRERRKEEREERRGSSEGGGSQEGREDIYSMRPHVWMPHSWVVSNILSVSDDGRARGN